MLANEQERGQFRIGKVVAPGVFDLTPRESRIMRAAPLDREADDLRKPAQTQSPRLAGESGERSGGGERLREGWHWINHSERAMAIRLWPINGRAMVDSMAWTRGKMIRS